MTRHLCISITGALKNWKPKEWEYLAKSNKKTIEQAKAHFQDAKAAGKRVLPMGECDNFDFQKGCLGHENKMQTL